MPSKKELTEFERKLVISKRQEGLTFRRIAGIIYLLYIVMNV